MEAFSIQNTGPVGYVTTSLGTVQCPRLRVKSSSSLNQSYLTPTQLSIYQTDLTKDTAPGIYLGDADSNSPDANNLSLVAYRTSTVGSLISSRAQLTFVAPTFAFRVPGTSTSIYPLTITGTGIASTVDFTAPNLTSTTDMHTYVNTSLTQPICDIVLAKTKVGLNSISWYDPNSIANNTTSFQT